MTTIAKVCNAIATGIAYVLVSIPLLFMAGIFCLIYAAVLFAVYLSPRSPHSLWRHNG